MPSRTQSASSLVQQISRRDTSHEPLKPEAKTAQGPTDRNPYEQAQQPHTSRRPAWADVSSALSNPNVATGDAQSYIGHVTADLKAYGLLNIEPIADQGKNGRVFKATAPGGFPVFVKLVIVPPKQVSADCEKDAAGISQQQRNFNAELAGTRQGAGTDNVVHKTSVDGTREYLITDYHEAGSANEVLKKPNDGWTPELAAAASNTLRLLLHDLANQLHARGAPAQDSPKPGATRATYQRTHHSDVKAGNMVLSYMNDAPFWALVDWGSQQTRDETADGVPVNSSLGLPPLDPTLYSPKAKEQRERKDADPRDVDISLFVGADADMHRVMLTLHTLLEENDLLRALPADERTFWSQLLMDLQPGKQAPPPAREIALRAVLGTGKRWRVKHKKAAAKAIKEAATLRKDLMRTAKPRPDNEAHRR